MATDFDLFQRFRLSLIGTDWGKSPKAHHLRFLVEQKLLKLRPRQQTIVTREQLKKMMLEAGLLDGPYSFEEIIENDLHACDQAIVEGEKPGGGWEVISLAHRRPSQQASSKSLQIEERQRQVEALYYPSDPKTPPPKRLQDVAQRFGVTTKTIQRDLKEISARKQNSS